MFLKNRNIISKIKILKVTDYAALRITTLYMIQEDHSGPEFLTCTMCTNHISLCEPLESQLWPQGHYLNKLGSGPLGDATYQISRF